MALKKFFIFLFVCLSSGELWALPYIPGCPLHESCVRALKQEQRERQRQLRQKESPGQNGEDSTPVLDENGNPIIPKKPIGLIFGFQFSAGDFNDKTKDYFSLRPSIGYMTNIVGLDLFAFGFYTLSLNDPGLSPVHKTEPLPMMQWGGFELMLGHTFDLSDLFSLGFTLDNQNQFNFMPDYSSGAAINRRNTYFPFAILEPELQLGLNLDSGNLRLTNSFPFNYVDDKSLDYEIALAYEWSFGFSVSLGAEWWNIWEEATVGGLGFEFGDLELILSYWHGPFFASLSFDADNEFKGFDLNPYFAYTFKKVTFFFSLVLTNLGNQKTMEEARLDVIQGTSDVTSIIPSIGVKLRI